MMRSFDQKIRALFLVSMVVAAIPVFAYIMVLRGLELKTLLGQIVFWGIDCLPLYYLWNNVYSGETKSGDDNSRLVGIATSMTFFIVAHFAFYFSVWYAVKGGGQGVSTTGIVFLILPIISCIVIIAGYYFGVLVSLMIRR